MERIPQKISAPKFAGQKLVQLITQHSKLEHLWDGVQDVGNLKHFDLSYSKNLIEIPNLSKARKLQRIHLKECTSLVHVPSSTGKLESLISLVLRGCSSIDKFPKVPRNIICLDLGWTAIGGVPASSVQCFSVLQEFYLDGCNRLQSFPTSFYNLRSLQHLFLFDYLKSNNFLQILIYNLEFLKYLKLRDSKSLRKFPEVLRNIEYLDLGETYIEQGLSSTIENLFALKIFLLDRCKRLERLPPSISKLKSLLKLYLPGCSQLRSLPEDMEIIGHCLILEHMCTTLLAHLSCSTKLDVTYCNISEILKWLGDLSSLRSSFLDGNSFYTLPTSIKRLSSLEELRITHCRNLQLLLELPLPFKYLDASNCVSLMQMSNSTKPSSESWDYVCSHQRLSLTKYLTRLEIFDCPELQSLQQKAYQMSTASIKRLSSLEGSGLRGCRYLQLLPELPLSVKYLDAMENFTRLISESWDDACSNLGQKFLFCGCLKLDHNNVFTEFQLSALRSMQYHWICSDSGPIHFTYPGNVIPEWFKLLVGGMVNKCQASSTLEQQQLHGFRCVLCWYSWSLPSHERSLKLFCKYHLMSKHGESVYDDRWCANLTIPSSDFVNMLYLYKPNKRYNLSAAVEALFNVSLLISVLIVEKEEKSKSRGVRMVHLQDAEEFGLINDQYEKHWEPNTFIDDPESSSNYSSTLI